MAIAYFFHWPLQKHKQERPHTSVANLRYNTRQKATHYIGAGGGLTPNYQHIKRVLEEREARVRKDSRLTENFMFALPRELDLTAQIRAVEKFGFRLTKGGQAPFYFSIHWEENNPHCHFVLIDQSRETGKTVAKAWERNSTHRFKRLWQDVANDDMAALGIDARIDFDAAEEKAERLRGDQANDNDLQEPDMAGMLPTIMVGDVTLYVDERLGELRDKANPHYRYSYGGEGLDDWTPPLDVTDEWDVISLVNKAIKQREQAAQEAAPQSTDNGIEPPAESVDDEPLETEDADDGDEDMATLELPGTPLENVLEAHRELETLHNAHAELQRVQQDFSRAVREFETAAVEAGVAHRVNELAKQAIGPAYAEYQSHLKASGKLKGFAIGIGRWQWKSQGRREAEQAALRVHSTRSRQEETAKALKEHQQQVQRWENAKAEYRRQEEMLNNQLRRYSNGKNQAYAERLFTNAIRKNMEKVSLEELRDLYEQGHLSEEKYRQILHLAGAMHELDDLDEATGKKQQQDRSEGY